VGKKKKLCHVVVSSRVSSNAIECEIVANTNVIVSAVKAIAHHVNNSVTNHWDVKITNAKSIIIIIFGRQQHAL
jgi:hypothetical protein